MDKARLAGLEGFDNRGGQIAGLCLQLSDVAHAMPAQAAVQAGARSQWTDELPRHDEQIIQRQQQHLAQFHDYRFLSVGQRRGQLMKAVRTIVDLLALLPFAHRGDADVVAFGQHALRGGVGLTLCSNERGGSGTGVNLTHSLCSLFKASMTPSITSLARNSGVNRRASLAQQRRRPCSTRSPARSLST